MSSSIGTPRPAAVAAGDEQQQKRPRKLWPWLVAASFALAVVIYAMAAYWPVLPPEKITQPAVTYSKASPDNKFAISLETPIDHPRNRSVDVTLVLTNWDEKKALQLQPLANGWPFQSPDCPALKIARDQSTAPVIVGPHSALTYVLHLVADCPSEAQPISLHYKAVFGANEVDGYILTGPLTVIGETRHTWANVFTLLNGLLHLFLAPLVLLGAGWWLNEAVQDRDKRQKKEQDDRDERLKREQEARDRRGEVLNTLISNYRDLVVGDYLPISRRMQTVESQLPPALRSLSDKSLTAGHLMTPLQREEIRGTLCAILLFRARLLHFLTRKGGIYFRSKQAESLFSKLISGFLAKVRLVLGDDDFRRAVDLLNPEDTLAGAIEKYKTGIVLPQLTAKQTQHIVGALNLDQDAQGVAQLAALWTQKNEEQTKKNTELYLGVEEKFLDWVNDKPVEFRAYTRLLQIATELLAFECDRPFYQTAPLSGAGDDESDLRSSGWYFDPPIIALKAEMYQIPEALAKDSATGEEGIYAELRKYWKNLPKECRGKVAPPA
jgi:hypothetical protein